MCIRDSIYIVKVPYCLRASEEVKIYEKLLRGSSLAEATCAPGTLRIMAQFAALTRLKEPENSSLYSKMLVYDGDNLKDTDPRAKDVYKRQDHQLGEHKTDHRTDRAHHEPLARDSGAHAVRRGACLLYTSRCV